MKKIICIDNGGYRYLTIDKTYYTTEYKNDYYYIISDRDIKYDIDEWYPEECFNPLSEYRNDKIDKLLN
jgi:hypothetical protein